MHRNPSVRVRTSQNPAASQEPARRHSIMYNMRRYSTNEMIGGVLSSMKPSLIHVGFLGLGVVALCHKALTYILVYPSFRLLFGTLYPAYASYKAVKTKNVKEYVSRLLLFVACVDV